MAFCTRGSALRQSFISPVFSTRLCEVGKVGGEFVLLCIPRAQLSACRRVVASWVFADQMNTCHHWSPLNKIICERIYESGCIHNLRRSGIPDSVRLSRTRGCNRSVLTTGRCRLLWSHHSNLLLSLRTVSNTGKLINKSKPCNEIHTYLALTMLSMPYSAPVLETWRIHSPDHWGVNKRLGWEQGNPQL